MNFTIKCKRCGYNFNSSEKHQCFYHPGTYTLFYNSSQKSQIYKYNCCNKLIGSTGCAKCNYHII